MGFKNEHVHGEKDVSLYSPPLHKGASAAVGAPLLLLTPSPETCHE
jgi:hypothetical protein